MDYPKRDETQRTFYNPLSHTLVVVARKADNTTHEYMLDPIKYHTYPAYIAEHLIKNLIDAVANERGINTVREPNKIEEIRKEICET